MTNFILIFESFVRTISPDQMKFSLELEKREGCQQNDFFIA